MDKIREIRIKKQSPLGLPNTPPKEPEVESMNIALPNVPLPSVQPVQRLLPTPLFALAARLAEDDDTKG